MVCKLLFLLPSTIFPNKSSVIKAEEKVPLIKVSRGPVKMKLGKRRAEIRFLSVEICYVTIEQDLRSCRTAFNTVSYRPTEYPGEGGILLWVKIFGGQNNRKMSHLSKRNKKYTF